MSFGGPLLKKRTKTVKVQHPVSRAHLLMSLESTLRALGYVHDNEEILEIDATIPKTIPITIRKRVIVAAPKSRERS